jgi:hypothetical protein
MIINDQLNIPAPNAMFCSLIPCKILPSPGASMATRLVSPNAIWRI